jgi:hypothetical protein
MDDLVIPNKDDDRALFQQMVGQFGGPAFLRRARRADHALAHLLQRLRHARLEMLAMVRLRLGQLHALAGGWERLGRFVDADSLTMLRRLFEELAPQLRLVLEPSKNDVTIQAGLVDLRESLERFNQRWREVLAQTDLREVNQRRDEYNRFYVFEKECVVGSARIARQGFRPLEPVTPDELAAWFPLLPDMCAAIV